MFKFFVLLRTQYSKHEIFATLLKESFTKMGNWFITLMSLTESEEAQPNTRVLETEFH